MSDYIKIELTKGKYALIDAEDEEKVLRWYRDKPETWYASVMMPKRFSDRFIYAEKRLTKKQAAYINETYPGILKPKANGDTTKNLLMHRLIMEAPHNMFVDHINGNTLDCRKENLRLCTFAQNCQNRKRRSDAASRHVYIGISETPSGKFRGNVRQNGKNNWTKCFNSPKEAAIARDRLAKEMYGEFARLNFPEEQ